MISSNARRRLARPVLSVLLAAMIVVAPTLSADAAGSFRTLSAANIRAGASTSTMVINWVTKGTYVSIDCYVRGQNVSGTTIWDHLTTGGYISDSLVLTGSNQPVVPECSALRRAAAARWALAHVSDRPLYSQDCTWFVSQALWAGGLGKSSSWSSTTYGVFHPTLDAVNADHLKNYLVNETRQGTIQQLSPNTAAVPSAALGDIIFYDWDANGVVDHAMIVTSFSGQVPNVTGHTDAITQPWNYSKYNRKSMAAAHPGLRIYLVHVKY